MKDSKKSSIPGSKRARRFLTPRVRKKQARSVTDDAIPRITNDTVSKHREEVISGAKKYIYPLQHSRHRIVIVSVSILVALIVGFATYTILSLYKFQSTSAFAYQITKVVPLPFAKVDGTYVPYEEYLFELRHLIHFFEEKGGVDFTSEQGAQQLQEEKKKIRDLIINNTYAEKIAREKGITVSEDEVNSQIDTLKKLGLLGSEQQVFEEVLRSNYDWSIADFRRSIKQQLLNAKVVQALDPSVRAKADTVLAEISAGKDFATAAQESSDDIGTKENGGNLGMVDANKAYLPQEYEALTAMQPGDVSGVIVLDNGLAIVKHLGFEGEKIKAAHIVFKYKELAEYLNDYKAQKPATVYVKID
ncbi:MAG TPA: peptidylprolyl isomerase [Candidatus Saccharibacteria bacterium]|nr:peptidylprolyl isomerase [Candidatus Saccharibacteria bacterium]HPR10358.1 peptidylprolyl isomerase [Candidatus Saccharibacteria bacterium]